MAGEGKEIVETVILPDCENDKGEDNGITDMPPILSHSEAFMHLINKPMMAEGTKRLLSFFSSATCSL